MPSNTDNLDGGSDEKCSVALLIVDMINDFDFPGGERLFSNAFTAAKQIKKLKARAKRAKIPVIYANDNFGKWRSDFRQQVRHCLNDGVRGAPIARLLKPGKDDYFVLKAMHSAFFATSLELLLEHLGVRTLILVGVAGDSCITFTALDAYLRHFEIILPEDAIASINPADNRTSLAFLERSVHARRVRSDTLKLRALCGRNSRELR